MCMFSKTVHNEDFRDAQLNLPPQSFISHYPAWIWSNRTDCSKKHSFFTTFLHKTDKFITVVKKGHILWNPQGVLVIMLPNMFLFSLAFRSPQGPRQPHLLFHCAFCRSCYSSTHSHFVPNSWPTRHSAMLFAKMQWGFWGCTIQPPSSNI